MYRPKFCAECGAKIIRLRWRLWTSRKFCGRCSPRFLKKQIIHAAIASAALFIVGLAVGHAARPAPPLLVIERSRNSPLSSSLSAEGSTNKADETTPAADDSGAKAGVSQTLTAPLSADLVYLCGARTKKGTPCTRRVHGPVRCWQHKGMPAMLAQEKLIVKEEK